MPYLASNLTRVLPSHLPTLQLLTSHDGPKMQSYTYARPGPPSTVLHPSTLPIPTLKCPTHVLVRISHCALNPGASLLMHLAPSVLRTWPCVPELDFSGTLVAAGPAVPAHRNLDPGVCVFGSVPVGAHLSGCGALTQYVSVPHDAVARAPANADAMRLAGLGVAGATALAVLRAADITGGDRVLVVGGSGGVGHLVVQMCLERVGDAGGVVAVCSRGSSGWVGALGDVEVVERGEGRVVEKLMRECGCGGFDAVLDCAGVQDVWRACPRFLKRGKPYVTVGPRARSYTYLGMLETLGTMAGNMLWPAMLGGTPRRYVQVAAAVNLVALEELAEMVQEGKLAVNVGMRVPWEDVMLAYEMMLSGHAQGKIVVEVPRD